VEVDALLAEAFDRLPQLVAEAVEGLSVDELTWSPAPGANSVGWLVWHLARIQDHHVADLLGTDQVYVTGDWGGRFGRPTGAQDTGYGHTSDDVAAVRPDGPEALVGYYAVVAGRTRELLSGLTATDLDRVVDRRWDPAVTLGVRLNSILGDDLQHVGQAAYVRGLLARR
jgi:hypothetical protein